MISFSFSKKFSETYFTATIQAKYMYSYLLMRHEDLYLLSFSNKSKTARSHFDFGTNS